MKTVTGNLIDMALDGTFDVIVHGCNCFCTMGAGIAKEIKRKLPEAYEADLQTQKGDKGKLGAFSVGQASRNGRIITVINAYTQYGYGRSQNHVDYEAIDSAFAQISKAYTSSRIGVPLIGAGHAGGDWFKIKSIIQKHMEGLDCTIVEFG